MTKPKYNWMWKRLAAGAAREKRQAKPLELRGDPMLRQTRHHAPHPTTSALERFIALTERVPVGDEYCVVWKGGDTFRVDDDTIATPARFYWEMMLGEALRDDEKLYKACKTAGCVKHKEKR